MRLCRSQTLSREKTLWLSWPILKYAADISSMVIKNSSYKNLSARSLCINRSTSVLSQDSAFPWIESLSCPIINKKMSHLNAIWVWSSLTCSKNFAISWPFQYVYEVELGKSGMAPGHSADGLDAIDHLLCQLDAVNFTVSTLAKAIITSCSSVLQALISAEVLSKVLELQRSPTINFVVAKRCHSEYVVFAGFHHFGIYCGIG